MINYFQTPSWKVPILPLFVKINFFFFLVKPAASHIINFHVYIYQMDIADNPLTTSYSFKLRRLSQLQTNLTINNQYKLLHKKSVYE